MNNQMTKQDWDEIDISSREIMTNFLSAIGATDIGYSVGNCAWDLSCNLNNKQISIEVKDRNMPHNKYSDMMVEKIK
jgi:hypothetical protein